MDTFFPDVVVTERFDYRGNVRNVDLIPVEYIGIMRLWCGYFSIPLVEQKQLKGHKGLWTDDKLKVLGLYNSTKGGHSNDAARQLLWFLTNELKDYTFIEEYGERKDGS